MKKRILSLIMLSLYVFFIGSSTVSAFNFPEPDWGELYYEKTDMVNETAFELYAQADIEKSPYYGAKYEPRGGAYMGAVAGFSDKLMPLGSYLVNIDEMNESDLYYPANVMVKNDNVVTMVGWTIYDMANVDYDHVRRTLENLNAYGKPMFIRFANEMNCSNLGDDPELYIEIFRRVADMVHEYPNLAMVWSPNDLGALDRPMEYFYPGDEYVDWVGVSCYMVKYFMGDKNAEYKSSVYFMTSDFAWATNKIKPLMEFMAENGINKPVMISESGVTTSNSYNEDCQEWATPRLRNLFWYLVMKYPQIKMINYFDVYRADEIEKFNISDYEYAVDIFNEAKNSGAYITEYGKNSEFVFQPANDAGTLFAKDGYVPLYTFAYIANQPELSVNYYIDDVWYHSSNQIPYKCNLGISDLSDGRHTLKISSYGVSKEYVLYKNGDVVRFGAEPDVSMSQVQNEIKVMINGKMVEFDQPPVLENNRTLVPLRKIFEALGAEVQWIDETQSIVSVKDNITINMSVGDNSMWVNGEEILLDVAPKILNGRTLVPVRAVSEAFKCDVQWDDASSTVIISY